MARGVGVGTALLAAAAAAGVAALGGDRPDLPVTVAAEVYPVLTERIEISPSLSVSYLPEVVMLARVSLDSDPRGAAVSLDGEERGHTPLRIDDLPLGAHLLVVRHADHATFRRRLRVDPPPPAGR